MEALILEASEFTPLVKLDPKSGVLSISGESRPENAGKYYEPIIKWIEQYQSYLKSNPTNVTVVFKYEYFNSTSAKYIMDILKQLDLGFASGNKISVEWHYDPLDEDMRDSGEEFSKLVKVPFQFIEIKED